MSPILKNYFNVIKKYKVASLLNFLSLAMAFMLFVIIGMQINYELAFNKCHKNYDKICRLTSGLGKERIAVCSPGESRLFASKCPEIKKIAITLPWNNLFDAVDTENELLKIRNNIGRVTEDFFSIFSYDITAGSLDRFKDGNNIVVSQSFVDKYYPGKDVIGKTLKSRDEKENKDIIYTIIAVFKDLPKNNSFQQKVYTCLEEKILTEAGFGNRSFHVYYLLNDGFTPSDLEASILNNIKYQDYPGSESEEELKNTFKLINYRFQPFSDWYFDDYLMYDTGEHSSRSKTAILLIVAIAIIIIAGINFNNLNTAISMLRVKTINTMKVLGNTNFKLRVSMILESIAEFLVAAIVGVVIVQLCRGTIINQFVTVNLSVLDHWGIIILACAIAILAGLLSGLYPALLTTSHSPALVLKGSFGLSPRGRKIKSILLCFQMFCSFVLLITAAFVFLQSRYMINAPLGFDSEVILTSQLSDKAKMRYDVIQNKILANSEFEAVGFSDHLIGAEMYISSWSMTKNDSSFSINTIPVRPGFIKTLGLELVEGRLFNASDTIKPKDDDSSMNIIINETAHTLNHLNLNDNLNGTIIVGIVKDFHYETQHRPIGAMCFLPNGRTKYSQDCDKAYFRIKKGVDTKVAIKNIRNVLTEIDPDNEPQVSFFSENLQEVYNKEMNLSILFAMFGFAALFISLSGVFGMVVFDSENKRKEIGVRKVMGSTTNQVLTLFAKYYLIVLCVCFAAAIPLSVYGLTNWLKEFPSHISLFMYVFIAIFIIMSVVTMSIVLLQNYHAANENPVKSLRSE